MNSILNQILFLAFNYLMNFLNFLNSLPNYLNKFLNNFQNQKVQVFDATKFQYEPVTYTSVSVLYERIKPKLANHQANDLLNNLQKSINYLPKIFEIADKSCCGQIRANGYFSICKIVFRFFERVEQVLNLKINRNQMKQELDHLNKITILMIKMIETCVLIINDTNLEDETIKKRSDNELLKNYPEFYRNLQMFKQITVQKCSTNSNLIDSIELNGSMRNHDPASINNSSPKTSDGQQFNSLPLFTTHKSNIFENIYEAIHQLKTPNKHFIFMKHSLFWLPYSYRPFLKFYMFLLPFLRVRFYRYFQLIFSSEYRAKQINNVYTYATINFPFVLWDAADTKIPLLLLDFKTRNTNTKSDELFVPTQNTIIINQSPNERLTINDMNQINFENDSKIRCKYIRPKNLDIQNCSKLLVNIHGGGYISQSCDNQEIFFRNWVDFNHIPILNIDYKIRKCFPVSLKDCLDVYLWLRMAPEKVIRSKLGFYPKQIVLSGDSAGGSLAFGILLILHDLRTDYKNKFNLKIQMPDALVCIYTAFSMNLSFCPSRIMSVIDPLVSSSVTFVVFEAILGLIPGLKQNTRFEKLKTLLFPSSDPVPWFVCERDELRKKFDFLSQIIISPYLNSLFYEKFDSLKDVPLHVISAEFCTFLDDSVTLAKFWKGPIKFDVLPDTCHGFLNLGSFSKSALNATDYCCQKVTEMFEQLDYSKNDQK